MTDNSVSRYFEFYRVNLNGEKKNTEWFLRFQSTMLLACHCFTDLNIIFDGIKQNTGFEDRKNFPHHSGGSVKFASPLNRYFSQITLTNRIYLYSIHVYL